MSAREVRGEPWSRSKLRIAALYDIHGNLPALEAVLRDVSLAAPDLVVVGGDVLPGPMPCPCLDLLANLEVDKRFISGNGERVVIGARRGEQIDEVPERFRDVIRWTASMLSPGHEKLIQEWPATLALGVAELGRVLFCHATPRSDTEIFTRLTPEERLLTAFEGAEADLVVCGHTHMQFERSYGAMRIVNAGSVGMAYGKPGAYWLLIDGGIELRCTPYDRADAALRIRATEYPLAEEFAEGNVLNPPSEEEMLAMFS